MLNYWRSVDNARIYYLHLAVDHILIHHRRWSTHFIRSSFYISYVALLIHWLQHIIGAGMKLKSGAFCWLQSWWFFLYCVPAVCFSRTFFMWSTKKWLLFINAFTYIYNHNNRMVYGMWLFFYWDIQIFKSKSYSLKEKRVNKEWVEKNSKYLPESTHYLGHFCDLFVWSMVCKLCECVTYPFYFTIIRMCVSFIYCISSVLLSIPMHITAVAQHSFSEREKNKKNNQRYELSRLKMVVIRFISSEPSKAADGIKTQNNQREEWKSEIERYR